MLLECERTSCAAVVLAAAGRRAVAAVVLAIAQRLFFIKVGLLQFT